MMDRWNYDIEVFPNLFCATFKSVETSEIRVFTIFEEISRNVNILVAEALTNQCFDIAIQLRFC